MVALNILTEAQGSDDPPVSKPGCCHDYFRSDRTQIKKIINKLQIPKLNRKVALRDRIQEDSMRDGHEILQNVCSALFYSEVTVMYLGHSYRTTHSKLKVATDKILNLTSKHRLQLDRLRSETGLNRRPHQER